MQINIKRSDKKVSMSLYVKKIEAEILYIPSELDTQKIHFRRFRFTTMRGDAVELFCSANDEKAFTIREVTEFLPLKKARARKAPVTGLKPEE
jgi:hypothetical protein